MARRKEWLNINRKKHGAIWWIFIGWWERPIANLFIVLAVILSDVMCAVVGYNYATMQWGIKYAGYSAPASTAFLCAIPFVVGIIVCAILAIRFRKK